MAIATKTTKTDEATQLHQAANGVTKYFTNPNYTVLGISYTPKALAQKLNGFGDQVSAISQGEQALKVQRTQLKTDQKTIRGCLAAVHWAAESQLGPTSPQLADFGFTPAKVPSPKPATATVARTAKANRTRKILNTMGPKQKKAAIAAAGSAAPAAAEGSAAAATPASTAEPVAPSTTASAPVSTPSAPVSVSATPP